MTVRKGLGQANILRTNNNTSTGYGVAYADEVSGHRTVGNLTALYALHDWQLSASGDNTGSDAIGQLWYVVDADGNGNGCYYQLKDWSKRKEAAGWQQFKSFNPTSDLSDFVNKDEFAATESDIQKQIATKANAQDVTNAIGELQDSINNIAVTGGASTAAAVTFDNSASGMTAVNAQGAIEELNVKKLAKTDIVQEPGNSEELVMSQKGVTELVKKTSTNDKLTELEIDVNAFKSFKEQHLNYVETQNTIEYSVSSILDGYVTKTGMSVSSSSYKHTEMISVKEGDVFSFKSSKTESTDTYIRFLCAFDENQNAIKSKGAEDIRTYSVPSGVAYLVISFASSYTINEPTCYIKRNVLDISIIDVVDLAKKVDDIPLEESNLVEYINPSVVFNDGYWVGGFNSNSSYFYFKVDGLSEGDKVYLENCIDGVRTARFADFYKGNIRVASAYSQNVEIVTIPAGVDTLYLSYIVAYNTNSPLVVVVKNVEEKRIKGLQQSVNATQKNSVITTRSANLQADETLSLVFSLNKKNSSISYGCIFDSFNNVEVAHGLSSYGNRAVIDGTKVAVYSSTTKIAEYEHNLVIEAFLNVAITRVGTNAYVVINTKNGTYKSPTFSWMACYDSVQAKAGMQTTDVSLSLTLSDIKKDIYLFGDSYTSLGDPTRYPYYLDTIYGCIDNMMMMGKGGIGSGESMLEFRKIIKMAKPKFLIWALGMNDPDTSSAVNKKWKLWFDEVSAVCDYYGIELILATIPNVPTINNSFKNAIVRESGRRYIDFAKAVNAESVGSTWYNGMLSNDGIHPSELGAKVLASRFIYDFPELVE